jgi:cation:H+ antiporter
VAISALLIAAGLVALIAGAELLVKGSTRLAQRMGMTPLLAGLLIASIGTSSPELTVGVVAALDNEGDLTLGNVIGSNIANIALILGLCAVIRPVSVHLQIVRMHVPIMIGTTVLGTILLWNGVLGRMEGVLLVALLGCYIWLSATIARKNPSNANAPTPPSRLVLHLLMTLGGIGLLVVGARLLVDGATEIAETMGVTPRLVGLTVVAVGTSLPELATSVLATIRRQTDVAVGNVVGSNIFNVLGILGAAAIVSPLNTGALNLIDATALLLTAGILLPLVWSGFRISRIEGALLLVGYAVYLGVIVGL